MFLVFIAITLGITYWASKRSAGASAYFAAGRQIKGWQNGIAVAGDYMSAASFLGIAGIIAFQGYDGFMFSVGWLVAYLTVLLVIAEPLRNAGKYTMADVLAYRLKPRPVRAMASLSTLTVSTFYMIAQMVGAGALVKLLLGGSVGLQQGGDRRRNPDDRLRGVRRHAGDHLGADHQSDPADGGDVLVEHSGAWRTSISASRQFFGAIAHVTYHDAKGAEVVKDFLQPGLRYKPPYGPLDLISLGLALIFGTAGLAAHPGPVLHRAGCQDGAAQRGVGDGADRQLLHHDHVPGFRRCDDRGSGLHQDARRHEHERAAAGQRSGRGTSSSRSSRRSLLPRFWRWSPD